ncbi:hypothetical protein LTR85_010451 [Meristemomyces frigidus]|nr:hypothetical protein LTR85_010451 [Meristemomyces frigidus]
MAFPQYGPAVPIGIDTGLPDADSVFPLLSWDMTADTALGLLESWELDSPTDTYSLLAVSDTAKSPGRQSHQNSSHAGVSSSLSPGTASQILTPTSTLLDYHNDVNHIEDPESDNFSTSPEDNISPDSDDYVHVGRFGSQPSGRRNMNNRPPLASGPGYSGGLGVPPTSHHLRAQPVARSISVPQSQWPSFTSATTSTGAWMDPQHDGSQFGHLNIQGNYTFDDEAIATTQGLNSDMFGSFDDGAIASFDTNLPFRSMVDGASTIAQPQYVPYSPFAPQMPQMNREDSFAPTTAQHSPWSHNIKASRSRPDNISNNTIISSIFKYHNMLALCHLLADCSLRRRGHHKLLHSPQLRKSATDAGEDANACDEGAPCKRCMDKVAKGLPYYFACDRSKLPDLVFDFLPPSMTLMHQKQTIEDCVKDQVLRWDMENSIDVYLTSGYGPALRWKLYEFLPRTNELLGQLQYLQNPATRASTRYQKYSPPFGLAKLDTSDDGHFEAYMECLLEHQHLWDFGWTCFEEETQINDFQAQLLDLMCVLYTQTQDPDLSDLLKKIIRMMIITYIMGHTLTIEENTAYGVLSAIRHSQKPNHIPQHTSPRLANRQLKFFFCVLRNQVYMNILNWQQQTLHSSKPPKEQTWLPAFCVMLGFAMVLEEVQRTIHIQADAKAQKNEMTTGQAETEAINACARIDERFGLLVGLFQCKYRDRKWSANGSFGNQTPQLHGEECERNFLSQLHRLLRDKRKCMQMTN